MPLIYKKSLHADSDNKRQKIGQNRRREASFSLKRQSKLCACVYEPWKILQFLLHQSSGIRKIKSGPTGFVVLFS